MANETIKQPKTKICPTCGTRMNETATRCLVCGRTFINESETSSKSNASGSFQKKKDKEEGINKPRLPEIRLSLPIAIGLLLLILAVGAGVVYFLLQSTGRVTEPTATATQTYTPTISQTPTLTATPTLVMSSTPVPPIEYTVKDGDLCASIAAVFDVSVQSIILQNNLNANCYLSPGQNLLIPYPTATITPAPTGTLTGSEATLAACGSYDYVVTSTDTLFGIALNYGVSTDIIRQYNGLTGDIVVEGSTLKIPLCERVTAGPTPTATNPPPYSAPNLLLPADGTSYNTSGETISLQWSGVGTLLANEMYRVVLEDVTEGTGRRNTAYVSETKYNVPIQFRPTDPSPHVIRWFVETVRQTGTQEDGSALYESAGARSDSRTFIWSGVAVQ